MITNFKIFENRKDINSPLIHSIIKYVGDKYENDGCDVYINSGQFLSNGRVSNFWYWRRVLPNGELGNEDYGYGDFEESDVVDYKVYTEDEIKEIYPKKYKEYLIKKDQNKYNL